MSIDPYMKNQMARFKVLHALDVVEELLNASELIDVDDQDGLMALSNYLTCAKDLKPFLKAKVSNEVK